MCAIWVLSLGSPMVTVCLLLLVLAQSMEDGFREPACRYFPLRVEEFGLPVQCAPSLHCRCIGPAFASI